MCYFHCCLKNSNLKAIQKLTKPLSLILTWTSKVHFIITERFTKTTNTIYIFPHINYHHREADMTYINLRAKIFPSKSQKMADEITDRFIMSQSTFQTGLSLFYFIYNIINILRPKLPHWKNLFWGKYNLNSMPNRTESQL